MPEPIQLQPAGGPQHAGSPQPAGGPSPALLSAVRRLLGPLVRLLLSHQITYPALTHLLKGVYVEEAGRAFSIPGRPQTLSRLSLLTGIHRKDVRRLQAETGVERATPANVSLGAQLVLRWTAESEYQNEDGRPRALPRLAGDRMQASFESLVESVTQDIRPRAILDEWQRLGIAFVDQDDHVHLAADAFVPSHGFEEKAYYLGRNIHDHLAAASHNLADDGRPMIERSVYYAQLRPASVTELQDLAAEVGMEALQHLNRRARELQRADESADDAVERMNFGVYFFRARLASSEEDEGDGRKNVDDDAAEADDHAR